MADQVLTLVEAAKAEPESQKTGYIGIYAESYQTNYVAPVQDSDRTFTWDVEDSLPYTGATGSRQIDADFDATQAYFKHYETDVKAYGGKIKVDEYIYDNMPKSIPRQEGSQVRAFARKQVIDTFEGAGGADLRGIRDWFGGDVASDGQVIAPGYENQVVDAGTTANGDLLTLDMLDDVIGKVDVMYGSTFIYCNDILARRIKKLNRGNDSSGYNVNYTPSEIGRFDSVYMGIPIVTLRDGNNTDLLSTTEYDDTTNATTMSLYVVTWGIEHATYFSTNPSGVAGVPMPMIEVQNDGSNYKYKRFKFYVGFAPQQPRSIARLKKLKNALS